VDGWSIEVREESVLTMKLPREEASERSATAPPWTCATPRSNGDRTSLTLKS